MNNVVKGRDNLSVTVYVPVDCSNACKFCTSKLEYKNGVDVEAVKKQLRDVRYSTIKEVVITGGEPTEDLNLLKELVKIVDNKDVYINTSLPERNAFDFIEYVNNENCIKGINISRHEISFEEDSKMLNKIASDIYIKFIKKSVKINVVLGDVHYNQDKIMNILDRWVDVDNGKGNISVSFRADYRKMDTKSLFTVNPFEDENISIFTTIATYTERTYCTVCHTMKFKYTSNLSFTYHRGLESTSNIIGNNTLEVNDIIISPSGKMYHDWDKSELYINLVKEHFEMESHIDSTTSPFGYKRKRSSIEIVKSNISQGCGNTASRIRGC